MHFGDFCFNKDFKTICEALKSEKQIPLGSKPQQNTFT